MLDVEGAILHIFMHAFAWIRLQDGTYWTHSTVALFKALK